MTEPGFTGQQETVTHIQAEPGFRWIRAPTDLERLADMRKQWSVASGRKLLLVEWTSPIIAWRIIFCRQALRDEVMPVIPAGLMSDTALLEAPELYGIIHPDGQVDAIGSHWFKDLDRFLQAAETCSK
jgi:hypothetical protein